MKIKYVVVGLLGWVTISVIAASIINRKNAKFIEDLEKEEEAI